jgi:hypothetical protein
MCSDLPEHDQDDDVSCSDLPVHDQVDDGALVLEDNDGAHGVPELLDDDDDDGFVDLSEQAPTFGP